jgi:hypothetical protein
MHRHTDIDWSKVIDNNWFLKPNTLRIKDYLYYTAL